MAHVKTAVSLQQALFERSQAMAEQMHISRSRLFALALEEFIRRRENQTLLKRINAAYSGAADQSERALKRAMRRQPRRVLEGAG